MPLPWFRMPPPEPEPEPEDDEPMPAPMDDWRLERLIAAGWDEIPALIIAADHAVDLHRACGLLENGCDQATAWAILF